MTQLLRIIFYHTTIRTTYELEIMHLSDVVTIIIHRLKRQERSH